MINAKPDTFVLVVAALSEKLVQKENQVCELQAHIEADHAEMDNMQRTITDLRVQAEEQYDLRAERNRLEDKVYSLESKVRNQDYLEAECTRLKEELLTLKFGPGDAHQRVRNYMLKEGGGVWAANNKILCIKGVKEVTGWGLKEAKDYVEEWGPRYADTSEETPSGTKRSQDLARVG
jgi:cell division protein FtsB